MTITFGIFPLSLPSAITAFGGAEGYFIKCLAIIAFGAFGFVVPKDYLSLRKNGQEGSRLLNLRRLWSSRLLLLLSI